MKKTNRKDFRGGDEHRHAVGSWRKMIGNNAILFLYS